MNRTRLVLILALVIIVGAVAAAFVFLQPGQTGGGSDNGDTAPTDRPRETALPTVTPIPITEVIVAAQDIPRGVEISPDMVEIVIFPREYLPSGTFDNLPSVIGRIARTDIARDQLIQTRHIIDSPFTQAAAELGRTGSDAAAVLDAGRVAISLPIDAITSVAYAVQPGDSVDVLVSMLFVDVNTDYQTILPNDNQALSFPVNLPPDACAEGTLPLEFCIPTYSIVPSSIFTGDQFEVIPINTGNLTLALPVIEFPSEEQRPRLVTQRTVKDAKVIWIGQFPNDGRIFRAAPSPTPIVTVDPNAIEEEAPPPDTPPTETPVPPRPNIITLGVPPQDAVVLTYMAEAGFPMTFALRSARAVGLPETQTVTLDFIMTTYGIQVPDRFSFAVEPAIRSIRQISLGERISLQSSE